MPEYDATVIYHPHPELPPEFYRVGSDGSLWGCQKPGRGAGRAGAWKSLKGQTRGERYRGFRIGVCGIAQELYAHHLVLETFVGPCPTGMECRHLNGDRSDNRLANLCWGTKVENAADRERHGTQPRGSKIPWSRLTEADIPVLRCRLG
jgi:hypothetical protein